MTNPFEPLPTEPVNTPTGLATLDQRLVAKLIDWSAGAIVWAPVVALVALRGLEDDSPDPIASAVVLVVFVLAVVLMLTQWVLLAWRGQTIGKMAWGVRVVRMDGSGAGFLHALVLREWPISVVTGVANVCFMGVFVWLADVMVGLGSDRRCLHDHIADTKVVQA